MVVSGRTLRATRLAANHHDRGTGGEGAPPSAVSRRGAPAREKTLVNNKSVTHVAGHFCYLSRPLMDVTTGVEANDSRQTNCARRYCIT
jgi:hypothetical protein